MDFFNDLGKKFSQAARSMQAFTRDSAESTRLAVDLRSARSELEQLYAGLGRAYFAQLSGDEPVPEELIEAVRVAIVRIESLTAQRDQRIRCPGCGAVQPPEARFCSNCGRRMPEAAPEPEESDEDAEFCPDCGAMRHGDAPFCAVCHHSFAEPEKAAEALPEPEPSEPVRPAPLEEPESYGE